MLLEIKDLRVRAEDKEILKGLSLSVNPGEVHAIMGPNGSGKSTLARALAGHPGYEVTGGTVTYDGKDLLAMQPEERACEGVFMAFQYPVEIAGINNAYFLKAALNAVRKYRGEQELDAVEFMQLIRDKAKLLEMDQAMLSRSVNEGFSGGEKKRNEIFQMAVLEPRLAILDETDSGLDIDALKIVSKGVNALRSPDARDHRRHALPAAAQLHRAGLRARAVRRPHRPIGRQGAGARARRQGLRLDRDGCGHRGVPLMPGRRAAEHVRHGLRGPARVAPTPARLAARRSRSRVRTVSANADFRRRVTRSGATRTSRRSRTRRSSPRASARAFA